MSQHNLTQGELLEATQQQGALYLERLQQLAAMGPPKDLTRKEKQTWAAFRKSMVIVGKRQREATDVSSMLCLDYSYPLALATRIHKEATQKNN